LILDHHIEVDVTEDTFLVQDAVVAEALVHLSFSSWLLASFGVHSSVIPLFFWYLASPMVIVVARFVLPVVFVTDNTLQWMITLACLVTERVV